jgi:putative transposase
MSFPAECTDSGDTVTKSKKIQISPTSAQKAILERWFGGNRFFYNRAVEAMKDGTSTNFKMLAPQLIADAPDWHVNIPRQIKVGAVMDACQAVRNAKVKGKQTGEFQKVKFRSRKQPRQTLYLRADTLKANSFYVQKLSGMQMTEPLPAKPQGQGKQSERDTINEVKDSQLIMENGRYFLCVTYVEKRKPRDPSGTIVALDPGVRTFMTYFTEDGFGWIGYQAINRIQRLCQT